MSLAQAAAVVALFSFAASAQEAVKPVPQEPSKEEREAVRKDDPPRLPPQAPKMEVPPKPVPQEPSKEEREAQRQEKPGEPATAADWARQERQKEGLPTSPPPVEETPAAPKPAEPKPEPPAAPAAEKRGVIGLGSPAIGAPGGLASAAAPPSHLISLSGYAILAASWTQQDAQLLYVGRNNGFALANARLQLTARPADSIWMFVSLDGAVAQVNPQDPVQGSRDVRLKDAYGVWAPAGHLRLQAGQFKAPQGVEELMEEVEVRFVSRSILTTGVGAPFGYAAPTMNMGRQLGIGLGTDRVPLGEGGIIAQVALMNGNGESQLYNDGTYPSAAARVAYDFRGVSLGVYGTFQPRLLGAQPNVFRDNVFGLGADVVVRRGPLHAMLLAQVRSTRHVTSRAPDEVGLGISGEAAWRFDFIEPALRLTFHDPTDQVPTDSLIYVTGGFNLYAPGAPGRLSVNFTHRIEQSGRDLSNSGLELAAQVRF